jgi:hypothetical protein
MIMTQDKARKATIRQRMAETGEPYSVARHAVGREHEGAAAEDPLNADRLQDRLGKLVGRFELLMSRAGQTTDPAHDEPKDTDSD